MMKVKLTHITYHITTHIVSTYVSDTRLHFTFAQHCHTQPKVP